MRKLIVPLSGAGLRASRIARDSADDHTSTAYLYDHTPVPTFAAGSRWMWFRHMRRGAVLVILESGNII